MTIEHIVHPGGTIGIIGGGQLGRMSGMAAARLGYKVHILTPDADAPALQIASSHTIGSYDDPVALRQFAEAVDVVTFEFENICSDGLQMLEALRPVRPAGKILALSQHRALEKTALEQAGLRVAPWRPVEAQHDLQAAIEELGYPVILKSARGGYDGKGQFHLADRAALDALDQTALPYPLVVESVIAFDREISVMVARGQDGTTSCFAPTQNHHVSGILDLSLAPAPIPEELAQEAERLAEQVATAFGLIGIMGVEMFVDDSGGLLVNEIAPRPHNSGHWTMNACLVDQFEMHIRAVCGLPLPLSGRFADAVMKNLVGPDDMVQCDAILETPGLSLHLYGKDEARPGRKMGHVNAIFPKGALPGPFGIRDALGPIGS